MGRALRQRVYLDHTHLLFQSSPVLWDGRYDALQAEIDAEFVSILARPVGRALQIRPGGLVVGDVFQSSPVLWDGRYRGQGGRF